MAPTEECVDAKRKGSIGIVVALIGHILIAILGILVIVMFLVPAYSLEILAFLYYFGWIQSIIGIVLAAIGLYLIKKRNDACLMK